MMFCVIAGPVYKQSFRDGPLDFAEASIYYFQFCGLLVSPYHRMMGHVMDLSHFTNIFLINYFYNSSIQLILDDIFFKYFWSLCNRCSKLINRRRLISKLSGRIWCCSFHGRFTSYRSCVLSRIRHVPTFLASVCQVTLSPRKLSDPFQFLGSGFG